RVSSPPWGYLTEHARWSSISMPSARPPLRSHRVSRPSPLCCSTSHSSLGPTCPPQTSSLPSSTERGSCSRPRASSTSTSMPRFAYTAGLVTYSHPEFVVFGLGARHARRVLDELAERVRDGSRFANGDIVRASTISPPDLRLVDILVPAQAAGGAEYALQVVY